MPSNPSSPPDAAARGAAAEHQLDVRLLGEPRIAWRGRALEIRSRKERALVAYLALRGDPVPRSELAELLWGHGRLRNVRQALYALRRQPGADVWLATDDDERVRIAAACDVAAFEAAVERGEHDAALRLWRPGFLEGWSVARAPAFADWREVERERLETLHRDALRGRVRELEAARLPAEAAKLAEELLRSDELDESAHRAAMRAAFRLHGAHAAAERFEACRRVLAEELGVAPSDETLRLAEALGRGEDPDPPAGPADARAAAPDVPRPGLHGREAAWARLGAAWRAGRVLVVSGPPGIGTTRLVREFVEGRRETLRLTGREGDREVPYAAATRAVEEAVRRRPDLAGAPWMRDELARLAPGAFPDAAPELRDAAPETGRDRLRRAILALLDGARADATIVVDDLHLVDAESLDVLLALAADPGPAPDLPGIVLAYREEADGRPLGERVRRLVAGGAEHVRLEGLDAPAVRNLLADLGPALPEGDALDRLARRLHRYTGGNPTFVLETVNDLLARHGRLDEGTAFGLPERVGALLRRRLDALSPSALRVARALLATRPDADPDLVAEVVDLDAPALMDALEELEEARVLEDGRFVHDLLPRAIHAHMSGAVRRFLHARAARALEARDDAVAPARIAHHRLEAREPERAAPHLEAAARRALAVYADEEARRRFFQVLWTTAAAPDAHAARRAHAFLGLEAIAARRGDGDEAAWALEAAEAIADREQDDALLYETRLRRAVARIRAGRPHEGMATAEEALAIAERLGDAEMAAKAALQIGGAGFHAGDLDAAADGFARAAAAGEPTVRLRAIGNLGVLAGIRGDPAAARRRQEEALTLAREHGTLEQVAALLNNLAATDERHARYDRARAAFDEALKLNRRTDDRVQERLAILNLAEIDTKRGAFAPALRALEDLREDAVGPRVHARTLLIRGQLERFLGRHDVAVEALDAALERARTSEDDRSEAVVAFNLAMARAASAGPEADPGEAVAALDRIADLGLGDVLPWAQAELAWILRDPEAIAERAPRIAPAHDNPHLALLAEMARHRAARLAGSVPPDPAPLSDLATGSRFAETPLALRLVADALAAAEPAAARRRREAAEACLLEQLRDLPRPIAAARRRFLDDAVRRAD